MVRFRDLEVGTSNLLQPLSQHIHELRNRNRSGANKFIAKIDPTEGPVLLERQSPRRLIVLKTSESNGSRVTFGEYLPVAAASHQHVVRRLM